MLPASTEEFGRRHQNIDGNSTRVPAILDQLEPATTTLLTSARTCPNPKIYQAICAPLLVFARCFHVLSESEYHYPWTVLY